MFMTTFYAPTICMFSGNPLEEKLTAEGTWRDKVVPLLGSLRKLDGKLFMLFFLLPSSYERSGQNNRWDSMDVQYIVLKDCFDSMAKLLQ